MDTNFWNALQILIGLAGVIPIQAISRFLLRSHARAGQAVQALYRARAYHISQSEIAFLVRHYVQHRFQCLTGAKASLTTNQLLKDLKRDNDHTYYFIIGEAGLGKTTALRYLFYRLYRSGRRDCVFLPMNAIDSPQSFMERLDGELQGKEDCYVFVDALDEAEFLYSGDNASTIHTLLSTIREYIGRNGSNAGHIRKFIATTRRGPLPMGYKTIENQMNVRAQVHIYEIQKTSGKDIERVYKSQRVLQKPRFHSPAGEGPQAAERAESRRRQRLLMKKFKRYLRENGDSFFAYPLFTRYAYLFLENSDAEPAGPSDRAAQSSNPYQIILEKAIKWEFHVYFEPHRHASSREAQRDMWQSYLANAYAYLDEVSRVICCNLLENRGTGISKRDLLSIHVEGYINENQCLTRHFMEPDDNGMGEEPIYSFCHQSFMEYFIAKYLIKETTGHHMRRQILSMRSLSSCKTFYFTMLCEEPHRAAAMGSSVETGYTGRLTLHGCLALEAKEEVCVNPNPAMTMAGLFAYLPTIRGFRYGNTRFSAEELCALLDRGELSLSAKCAGSLSLLEAVAPLETLQHLDLHETSLGDCDSFAVLSGLGRLLTLDLRRARGWKSALPAIQNTPLQALSVYVEEAADLEELAPLPAKTIYMETEDFSAVWIALCQLRKRDSRFEPFRRTGLAAACKRGKRGGQKQELPLMKAVYSLEEECFGLAENADATYWNGISLVSCLYNEDYLDESGEGRAVLDKLEPYLKDRDDLLGLHFCYCRGRNLLFSHNFRDALPYYKSAYERNPDKTEAFAFQCGVALLRAYIRTHGMDDAVQLSDSLLQLAMAPDHVYQKGNCLDLLKYRCALFIVNQEYDKAARALEEYARASDDSVNNFHRFYSLYYSVLCWNRTASAPFDTEPVDALYTEMEGLLRLDCDKAIAEDRHAQSYWIMYNGQKLITHWIQGDLEAASRFARELLAFPYRTCDINQSALKYVIDRYEEDLGQAPEFGGSALYKRQFLFFLNKGIWM